MNPDLVNGLFETFGGVFIFLSVLRLYKEKKVAGISWLTTFFFMTWGYWNLYYYPHLGQTISYWGGIGVVTMNTIWVLQLLYYSYIYKQAKERHSIPSENGRPEIISSKELNEDIDKIIRKEYEV